MSNLLLPRRFYNQPQGAVQIDWSNPLTRGLVFAWLGSNRHINLVDNKTLTVGGRYFLQADKINPYGVCVTGRAASDTNMYARASISPLPINNCSMFWAGETTVTGGVDDDWRDLLSVGVGSNDLLLELTGGDKIGFYTVGTSFDDAGAGVLSAASVRPSGFVTMAATTDSGANTCAVYVNGSPSGSSTWGATAHNATAITLYNRTTQASTRNAFDHANTAFVFSRTLGVEEVASISANPWQIFKVSE